MWARIAFLGVWDTVGALGFPYPRIAALLDRLPWFRHRFHNTRLSESVVFGCHALAIDDERLAFHPTLWDEPDPRVEHVRFAGMHSDVGGGYAETQLADITLQWMARHAMARGLLLYERHLVTGDPRADGVMHDSRTGIQKLYRRRVRSWRGPTTPKVHPSVVERSRAVAGYRPWILEREYEVAREPGDQQVFVASRVCRFRVLRRLSLGMSGVFV